MSNQYTRARVLSQLVEADERNEMESPSAKVARARLESQDLQQRLNRLRTYNSDNSPDYSEADTQSNGLMEFLKMAKDDSLRTGRGVGQSARRNDITQNVNMYQHSPEQRDVIGLLESSKQNQQKQEFLTDAIKQAKEKGQFDTVAQYERELEESKRLAPLYGLTDEETNVANSTVISNSTKEKRDRGLANTGGGVAGFSNTNRRLETLSGMTIKDLVDRDYERTSDREFQEGLAIKRGSEDNFKAIRDRQRTFAGEDGEQGGDAFFNSLKALAENPASLAYQSGQILAYTNPFTGIPKLLADIDNFANTTEKNLFEDTGRSLRNTEEKQRQAVAYAINVPVSYLDRLLGKAAVGGAGSGGKIAAALGKPVSKINEKITSSLASLPKAQGAYKAGSKAVGGVTKATGIAAVDTGVEVLQEGTQTALEQIGSSRKLDAGEIFEAAAIGGGVGGAASISGAGARGVKYAASKGVKKVTDKVAESKAPMKDDDYLDSDSKKYSPVAVVEDANKAMSTGNATQETIKQSKARIDNAKKTVNKEIQDLERLVSLKTKQQQLIADGDLVGAEANIEVINSLEVNIPLKVAQERLTQAREAKITMEAAVTRAESKVVKESKRTTNVAKATKLNELFTSQEATRTRLEEIDTQLTASQDSLSQIEIESLNTEKLTLENTAIKNATQIAKLDPDGLVSDIKATKEDTTVTPQTIKQKLSGILKSPEVTANVGRKAELEELGRKLDLVSQKQNELKKPKSVNGDIVEGGFESGKEYRGTKQYISDSVKAVDNNNEEAYKTQLGMLKNFETSHTSKAKAMNAASIAFAETGKTQLVYREEGKLSWTHAPKTLFGKNSARNQRAFGALDVHSGSKNLVQTIEKEAKHIKETREFIENYKATVKPTSSTKTKGKNTNAKPSDTTDTTDSSTTNSNKSESVTPISNKPVPKKNDEKNMVNKWGMKKDGSGETFLVNKNIKDLKVETAARETPYVIRKGEESFYSTASDMANKAIVSKIIDKDKAVWEGVVTDTFGDNTNSKKYSKDDVVLLVIPNDQKAFTAMIPDIKLAMEAGADILYMPGRYADSKVMEAIITKQMRAIATSNGYDFNNVTDAGNLINSKTKLSINRVSKVAESTTKPVETETIVVNAEVATKASGKTKEQFKEDWKKLAAGTLSSKWQEDYLNKYERNRDKGEDYLKELFPNAANTDGKFVQAKWDAFVELVTESNKTNASQVADTITSSKTGLVHNVPSILVNKTFVMAKQLEAIKEVSSKLLSEATETYTNGLRDVFLDIIVASGLPVGITLINDFKKLAAIEKRKANGEFIADAWIKGKNTEVRINLNNSYNNVDIKTILTHELSHIVTIDAINKVTGTNSPLDIRLKGAMTVFSNWLEANRDTIDDFSLSSLDYALFDAKEFITVNTTQEEAINHLVNIPFGEVSLYQEIVAINNALMKESYGNKITPQIEEKINVLSSEYEAKRKETEGNNESVSTNDGRTDSQDEGASRSSTSNRDEQLSGQDTGQTEGNNDVTNNTVTSTENEVSQGNKTLLSQDEDIFTSVVLARDWERMAEVIGQEVQDNNIRQLESYIEFHELFTTGIEKLIDNRAATSNENNALYKYLAVKDETGKLYLPKNVVAAISLSAYKYIQTEGKRLKLTDAQLMSVHGLDPYTNLYDQARYNLSNMGSVKGYLSQNMGKVAYAALDLSIGDDARVNTKEELQSSLGAVVYTLLQNNTDLIREYKPKDGKTFTHRERLTMLVNSMPLSQAKSLVEKRTDIDVNSLKNKAELVKALKNSKHAYLNKSVTLARINNSYDKKTKQVSLPQEGVNIINGSLKNPGEVDLLDKLFSVPRERAEPHDKAPKFSQETAKESRSLITPEAQKALEEVASYEWGIEGTKADLVIGLYDTDRDALYSLLGLKSDKDINSLHPEIRDMELIETITRKNLIEEQIEWLKARRNEDGTYKGYYQLPVVWQNSRFGYESTLFNAQTDIFARMLTNLKGWKATVDTKADAPRINEDGTVTKEGLFYLALAEKIEGVSGVFGKKFSDVGYDPNANTPDKVGPSDYLPEFVNYLENDAEFKQAVSVMRDLLNGEKPTQLKLDTLKEFTELADTGELALGMLVEYIAFTDAREAGTDYTTHIGLQSDGITNGPAITDILFGVFNDEKLIKAGIIPESRKDDFANFFETKKAGYTDKYQDTGVDMKSVMFSYMPKGTSITDLLSTVDDKFGSRSWAKKLVTPFNYGSGSKSMKRNIANGFVDKVVGDYHSLHNIKDAKEKQSLMNEINGLLETAHEISTELKKAKPLKEKGALAEIAYLHNNNTNDIAKQINLNVPDLVSEIMTKVPKFIQNKNEGKSKAEIVYAYSVFLRNNFEVNQYQKLTTDNLNENFSYFNRELLENLVDISFGTASARAINTSEARSVAFRQDITDVTIRAVEMEKFAEDILIDSFVPDTQLPETLDMANFESPLEAKRFHMTIGQKKLVDKEMDKHRATMHSGLSSKYKASRDSGITVAKEGLTTHFGEQIIFGNPLRTKETANTQGPSITFTYGYSHKTTENPGVSAPAMAVQSLDAAIATEVVSKFKSMNLHDAASFSIVDYVNGVKAQNQAFYEAVTEYDIGTEALQSYLAPLKLLRTLLDSDSTSDEAKQKIKNFIFNEVEGNRVHDKTGKEIGPISILESLAEYAGQKIDKLPTIHTVQQYGGVDGQVIVDKVDTSNKMAEVTNTIKEAKDLISGRETKPVEVITPIVETNTTEIVKEISTNKLSLTGLIGVLSDAMPGGMITGILNNLSDVNLSKVKVKESNNKELDNAIVKFSKLNNTLYINKDAFNVISNNDLIRTIQRATLEAALHNNLKAVKNGGSKIGNLNDSYKGMQLLVNALPSMVDRAYKEDKITEGERKTILRDMKIAKGNSVEYVMSELLVNSAFGTILKKVPNYTDIDSKDIKSGNIFSKVKEFIIDLVTNGFDSPNRESIYDLLSTVSKDITSELQSVRSLSTINGLINQSMIINKNQETTENYDYEYDNAFLNGYDTRFHLEIAKMTMNSNFDNPQFDAQTVLSLANSLLTNSPHVNDEYNQNLLPVIEMLQKYMSKGTKVVMVQSRESINEVTKNVGLQEEIAESIEEGRSLAIKLNGTNYVFLSNAMVSSNADTKIATVVHEILHAFTSETLNSVKNKAIKNNFIKMRKLANEQISQSDIDANYQLEYALNESLDIDEFVVQVLTVPSVRRALEAINGGPLVKNEGRTKEPMMFSEMAGLFGYESNSQEATFLNNFAKMFGKLTLNNKTSRKSAIEVETAVLGSQEAYRTARVKQQLIDIGFLENIQEVAKTIAEETKDLDSKALPQDVLNFIKQKAAENNESELLDSIATHEQQDFSQRILQSPEIRFTPKEVRSKIQDNDVSESSNKEYLNIIESVILTPLDYLIDDTLVKGFRPESIWHDAVVNGENLTVSNAYDVGFELNNEQGYMLETLESVLSKVIDKVNNTAAYRQMESVYKSAKDVIVASDFHDGDWDTATQEERQIAREKLTYLFRPQDNDADGKSNYLVRFAALSMVSPEIQEILNFKDNVEIVGETWFEKATSLFSEAIEIVDGGFSGVSGRATLNSRISELAISMAKTYAKENDKLSDIENNLANGLDSVQEMFSETIGEAAKKAGIALTDTDLAQKYPIGRLTNKALKGELDRFQEYANFFMDYVGQNSPLGAIRETLNETLTDTSKEQELATDSFNVMKIIEKKRGEIIDAVRRNILGNYSKANSNMTREETKAVSNLLRTDIQSLKALGLTHAEIMDMVADKTARNQKAKELLDTLPPAIRDELNSRGDNLAYYLVKGVAKKPLLAKNATAILSRVGMGKGINTNFNDTHVKNLDALITLYALNYSNANTLNAVTEINSRETGDINGLEHTILSHKKFTEESDALFMDNPFSKQKGFLTSIYNTDRGFAIVKRSEVQEYLDLGYKENATLESALKEDEMTNKEDMVFMTLSNTGKQRYVSGAFSVESPGAKGSSVEFDSDKFVSIAERQRADIDTTSHTNMIPIYDTEGNIRGYRYEMGNTAKDKYLDRNNDFSTLLAQFKGSNLSKENFPDSNKRLVDALIDKAKNMKENELNSYILISPNATSKRAREFWAMLPKETRMYIESQTSEKGILVKKNELNLLIGYRKYNPSDAFTKELSDRNIAETVYTAIFEGMFGKKAKLRFDQGFKPLIEMVNALKNFIVIRGIKVLIANIKSNVALLMLNDFSPVQSTRDIKDALVYSIKYQNEAGELAQLEHEASIGYGNTTNRARMTELKNSIARNPLKAFIEEGMMPMIVNDFSFKKGEVEYNDFIDDIKDMTVNKLPKPLKATFDVLTVAEGTKLHNFLSNATQQSDFVFKYAIYKQDIRKGKTNKQALNKARDVFINYDIPTNKFLQFVNDTGLWMFTKFALRIQRVILRMMKEKPLRLATEAFVSEQLGNPSIISLNLVSSLNGGGGLRNPMSNILSMYEHALPIQLLQSVFK